MQSSKKNHVNSILNSIKEILKLSPNLPVSTHLSMALSDYDNFDGISNKEFAFILDKYKCQKELDIDIPHSSDIRRIIEEGTNFDKLCDDILGSTEEDF